MIGIRALLFGVLKLAAGERREVAVRSQTGLLQSKEVEP